MMRPMQQLGLDFTRIGQCEACGHSGVLNARICRSCERTHGRRVAELLARCRQDTEFARRCYLRLAPAERGEFLRTLGHQVLGSLGPGLRKCLHRPAALRLITKSSTG